MNYFGNTACSVDSDDIQFRRLKGSIIGGSTEEKNGEFEIYERLVP